jgi:hypothetical protein
MAALDPMSDGPTDLLAVIEQGFLDFVEKRHRAKLPLFYDRSRSRGGKPGIPQFKKVAERLRG